MHLKYCSAVLYLLLTSAITLAQSSSSNTVDELFAKFKQTNSDKSIVMSSNRNIYLAGEKIWFTAYVVDASSGKLDLTTKNLFADLVNEKDSVIQQLVLDNESLHTDGAFNLPASIPTGFYLIRCYTATQLEHNSSGIFLHPVFIVNKQLHDESRYAKEFEKSLEKKDAISPNIHFFAERLTALPGIISTGVIEILNAYNNPLSVEGELINSKDSIITSFKTNSLGLARLTFVNDFVERYTAVFHVNGQTVKSQLPEVNKNAIQLSVVNQTAKTIKAFVTIEDSVPAAMHTSILAVQNDSLYYAAAGTGNYGITIPINKFSGGIARLLLFDENKNLVSERKIYIPKENVELEIKPDKKEYSKRDPVNVHIKVTGQNRRPYASVLNVAVEDEWIRQFSDSIEAKMIPPADAFLLNNWLSRYHAKYSAEDIDLLMTTRKSVFQQAATVALDKNGHDYDDNKKLRNVIGKIITKKGNGISERIVTALAKNSRDFFMDVDTTDKEGHFKLAVPQSFDSLQLSLRVADKHQVQTLTDSIIVENFEFPHFSTPIALKQQFLASNIHTLSLVQKYHIDTAITFRDKGWLTPVTVKTIKKEALNYDASKRLNPISQILTSDKFRYGGYNAIGYAILMVPGISLTSGDISIFGPNFTSSGTMGPPLIIMDGSEVPSKGVGNVLDFLNSLNPADIDFIEVLRGAEAGIYGIRGGTGVISINTKHGPDKTGYNRSKLGVFTPVTYHVSPRFEMPDYSNKELKNSSGPDPRTTLYWSGKVVTDANGEATVSFYTADNVTNYAITVTGLTAKGDQIYKRLIIGGTAKNR